MGIIVYKDIKVMPVLNAVKIIIEILIFNVNYVKQTSAFLMTTFLLLFLFFLCIFF